jgi:hypothetical protein
VDVSGAGRQSGLFKTDEHGPSIDTRTYRLATQFYGAICAHVDGDDQAGTSLSVPTCEKVPTSPRPAIPEQVARKLAENPVARDTFLMCYRRGVGDAAIEELAEAAVAGADAADALQAVMGRDDEREAHVVELCRSGEVAHAKRLATCGRQSVQLECPELGGGCGHEDNYVPISCDSILCPDCGSRRQGQAVERFGGVVEEWDAPTMLRFSLPERVDATEEEIGTAVDRLRDAFGKLRRRVIPTEGEHQGKRWVWENDGGEPADAYWKQSLRAEATRRAKHHGDTSLFGRINRWEREYVEEGRGIPMDELLRSGIYGIDAKQGDDGTVNVHAHAIGEVPYIPQPALSAVWDDLTDAPVVDVRRVEERGEKGRETALMETVGYAAKPPEYRTTEAAVEYLKALKGSKLIQPFGELHGNTPDDSGELRCERCENTPSWWNYKGVVDERIDNMGKDWEEDGDRPPPEDTRNSSPE